uniref:Granulins domain-containing protein n=1 Tax=Cyprinus carpio TaxID=7962 RepID=A0A8C1ZAS6_CYPCA
VLKLSLSFPVSSVHSDVPCDSTKSCPDGSTCCKTQEGGWACCPLPQVNHLIY